MKPTILALLAALGTAVLPAHAATVFFVTPAGNDSAAGTSWPEAKATILAAVEAASAGDEVRVAEGTYPGAINDTKGLALRGGYLAGETFVSDPTAHPTVIAAAGAGSPALTITGGSIVDGFQITGGATGIRCVQGTGVAISRNTITGALSQGIYLTNTSATVTGNTIADTGMAIVFAGGSSGPISANRLHGCDWGGISCDASSPEISENQIVGALGAGIVCSAGSNGAITRNLIYGSGGRGIACVDSSPPITLNRIQGNIGGGVSISNAALTIAGNVIADNGLKGVFTTTESWTGSVAYVTLLANTIAGHPEAGVMGATAGEVSGNILSGNGASFSGAFTSVDYNCVFNNPLDAPDLNTGEHSISADPQFVAAAYGNYHILRTSPCRDAGGVVSGGVPSTDMDGQPRVKFAAVDIGADESDGLPVSFQPARLYANPSAPPGGDGSSWAAACRTLADAAARAALLQGADIWAAGATYAEQIALFPYTHLYGGFAGTETALAARSMKANETIVDAGGVSGGSTGIAIASAAGVNGVTITNAERGVEFGDGSGSLIASKLLRNQQAVGDMRAAAFRLDSCFIVQNGGTLPATGSGFLTLNNLTIADNEGYAAIRLSSPLTNTVLAFNSESFSIPDGQSNYHVSNAGMVSGQSTPLSSDPRFVAPDADDFHLLFDSPLRDRASAAAAGSTVDADGERRVENRAVDIGADEVGAPVVTIAEAMASFEGESCELRGLIAATASGEFPGVLHVLQPDRTAGAALPGIGLVNRGDRINVIGRVELVDGQWRIDPDWDYTRSPGPPPRPWNARSDAVSADRNGDGVRDAGPPTSGLLMKAAGRLTSVDWARKFFYLDDGAGMLDGTAGFEPHSGVRVAYRGLTSPGLYSVASVTGIVQWEQTVLETEGYVNGEYHAAGDTVTIPVIYPRDQSDIVVHQQETGL